MKYIGTPEWRVKEENNIYNVEREFIVNRFLRGDKKEWRRVTKSGDAYVPGQYAVPAIQSFGSLFQAKMTIKHFKELLSKDINCKYHNNSIFRVS